jgi:hypothetical protein
VRGPCPIASSSTRGSPRRAGPLTRQAWCSSVRRFSGRFRSSTSCGDLVPATCRSGGLPSGTAEGLPWAGVLPPFEDLDRMEEVQKAISALDAFFGRLQEAGSAAAMKPTLRKRARSAITMEAIQKAVADPATFLRGLRGGRRRSRQATRSGPFQKGNFRAPGSGAVRDGRRFAVGGRITAFRGFGQDGRSSKRHLCS